MRDFKIGDIVQVRGCNSDFTDHLDGKIGTVVDVDLRDCLVRFDDADLGEATDWYIWKVNMTHA